MMYALTPMPSPVISSLGGYASLAEGRICAGIPPTSIMETSAQG
jgi:hypothetical protein